MILHCCPRGVPGHALDDVFYNASIIWGVIGPLRMFTKYGVYKGMNWFFLFGFLAPIPGWFLSRKYPNIKWLRLIHMPIIIGATASMPPARSVNYWACGAVGIFFNFYVYRKFKAWWAVGYTYLCLICCFRRWGCLFECCNFLHSSIQECNWSRVVGSGQ